MQMIWVFVTILNKCNKQYDVTKLFCQTISNNIDVNKYGHFYIK